jgi:hypothetical protein
MTFENPPHNQKATRSGVAPIAEGSYLDWSAVLAGGVFALAISFLLISFGTGLGLSLTSPYRGEGVSASWLAIASGIGFVWVMVTGFGAGGYLAGRMRRRVGDATPDEVAVRDGAHGLMVWAVGALVSTVLATAGSGGILSAGASAVSSAAETATDVASDLATSGYFANVMLRSGAEAAETEASAGNDAPAAADDGSNPVVASVIDGSTGDTGTGAGATTTPNGDGRAAPTNIDPAVQQEVAGILARNATSGDMADRDRTYLAQLVAANTDLDQETALARVEEINGEIADARTAALDAVEDARVAGVVFGFIAAATLLIGAIAAFFSATTGGHHRDESLRLDVLVARN